jgi:uncharacterized Fe-S cluster protein YjdI
MCKGYQSDDILDVFQNILSCKHSVLESMPHIYAATRPWVWPKAATTYSHLFAKSFDAGLG